ncbi:MAG: Arc family DNA binding domain-containing protein [Bacteroidetes bacterium]|nr:MAG: Arc family DNA binding domain-containing protein [Bacteroidota bacterium]
MSKKKVFMLRLHPAVYTALEKWAADEFRSVNGQVEWILDRALREIGRSPKKTGKDDIQKKA